MFERMKQGAVDILQGDVPLNLENIGDVRQVAEQCLTQGQPRLVINLEQVPLIDSAGLEFLLDVQDRCFERGGVAKIAAANALCREILHVTGVGRQFETFAEVPSAVGSFVS